MTFIAHVKIFEIFIKTRIIRLKILIKIINAFLFIIIKKKTITLNFKCRIKHNKYDNYYRFRNLNTLYFNTLSFCALSGSILLEVFIYVKSFSKINNVYWSVSLFLHKKLLKCSHI